MREFRNDRRILNLSLLSGNMDRDKQTHSHWFLITQTQKIGIPLVAASEDDTYDQNGNPSTLPHLTPSTQSSPQQVETLIQLLFFRFWYLISRTCVLF